MERKEKKLKRVINNEKYVIVCKYDSNSIYSMAKDNARYKDTTLTSTRYKDTIKPP